MHLITVCIKTLLEYDDIGSEKGFLNLRARGGTRVAEERVYKTTEAQRKATAKRMAKMDSLSIWLKPEEKEALRQKAAELSMSMTAYIKHKCGI